MQALHSARRTVEELELTLLLEALYQWYGDDFRGYETAPLHAKLRAFMDCRGITTLSGLQSLLMHDPLQEQQLLFHLQETGSAVFGQPEHFLVLREALLPLLRSCPHPRLWIAECSHPEPIMSLAIFLEEEGLYARSQLFATSACMDLLERSRALRFPADKMAAYQENYLRSGGRRDLADYVAADGEFFDLLPRLKRNITWAQHDLNGDASFNEFHFLTCQRPLNTFGAPLRRRVAHLFGDSLCTYGILEVVPDNTPATSPFSLSFTPVSPAHGIYRRAT